MHCTASCNSTIRYTSGSFVRCSGHGYNQWIHLRYLSRLPSPTDTPPARRTTTYEMCACPTPCEPSSFCGSDGICRPYNCNSWYQYANITYTSYDASLPLSCEGRSKFDPEFDELVNPAVVFGCTGFSGTLPSPPEGIYQVGSTLSLE